MANGLKMAVRHAVIELLERGWSLCLGIRNCLIFRNHLHNILLAMPTRFTSIVPSDLRGLGRIPNSIFHESQISRK